MLGERSPEHSKNLQAEDNKAPEDEKMHPSGRLLASDKFLLAKGVDEYRLKALSDVIKAVDRPSGEQEPQAVIDSAHKEPHSDEHDQGKKQRRHSSVPFTGVSPPRRGTSAREALGLGVRIGGEQLFHTQMAKKMQEKAKATSTICLLYEASWLRDSSVRCAHVAAAATLHFVRMAHATSWG